MSIPDDVNVRKIDQQDLNELRKLMLDNAKEPELLAFVDKMGTKHNFDPREYGIDPRYGIIVRVPESAKN